MKVKHFITTSGIILGGLLASQGASAVVTYQGSSDVQFTFSSSLSLAVAGGDFIITDLFPGNRDISNEVTLTVSTNNATGYALSATVGNDTTYNSTALLATGGASIAMMPSGNALTSGTWGYTLDNGTTYGALSKTIDTTLNKTVNSIGTAAPGYGGTDSTRMKIGAYAAIDQTPGVYNNVVNFKAVSNVATHTVTLAKGNNVSSVTLGGSGTSGDYTSGTPVSIAATCKSGHNFVNWALSNDYGKITNASAASTTYNVGPGDVTITAYCDGEPEPPSNIQEITLSSCPASSTTMTDARDGNDYTIATLSDGKCWMTQNLRYVGDSGSPAGSMVMKAATSNIDEDITIAYGELKYSGDSSPNSYTVAKILDSGDTTTGVWYNYVAATATSITGDDNVLDAIYDICPKGWRLPTNAEQVAIRRDVSTYNPVDGGYYGGGFLNGTATGAWWSSTAYNGTRRYYVYWANNTVMSTDHITRTNGYYVRCVLK